MSSRSDQATWNSDSAPVASRGKPLPAAATGHRPSRDSVRVHSAPSQRAIGWTGHGAPATELPGPAGVRRPRSPGAHHGEIGRPCATLLHKAGRASREETSTG